MTSNKYLNTLTGIFKEGFMTYPQFELSYLGDKNFGTIGIFDWDKNIFTLNTKYEYYEQAKNALVKSGLKHKESALDDFETVMKAM